MLLALSAGALMPTLALGQVVGDFNGDGKADLAIGVPYENVLDRINAGGVHVLYGSAQRLTTVKAQYWHQDHPKLLDSSEIDDRFGSTLAVGDFNGDGYDDLAIGVPGEDLGVQYDAGAVVVLYGSKNGLRPAKNQFWHQSSEGMLGDGAELGDQFGAAITAGDFNNDGFWDLAIGSPGEDIDGIEDAGVVHILYGTANGLRVTNSQLLQQGANGALDAAEEGDRFGASLVAAKFRGGNFHDLAVGVPGQTVSGFANAGAVHVFRGSANRIIPNGNKVWTQDSPGILGEAAEGDQFGFALAAGDFNKDGRMDLVIGVPYDDFEGAENAGAVHVLYSAKAGPVAKNNQYWHQNVDGMPDAAEDNDNFGFALAAGDFNNDGFWDLAIGAPFESIGAHVETGAVVVLRGSANRLVINGVQWWHQDTNGVPGQNSQWDNFGASLSAGDFNGDGRCDLAIGVPGAMVEGVVDAGAVTVLYAKPAGLRAANSQWWHQNILGQGDGCEQGDLFGASLTR